MIRKPAPIFGWLMTLTLLAACGADGEPETPTRAEIAPSALITPN